MNFACELMDLCRGTQEVAAVLSEGDEQTGAYDPLDRLKMAMNYEEKKASTYFSCTTCYRSVSEMRVMGHGSNG